jgi:hypothetical protein
MAKRLRCRIGDIRYAPFEDGWIFLYNERRIIWGPKTKRKRWNWVTGEEWIVPHDALHREHPGYDE